MEILKELKWFILVLAILVAVLFAGKGFLPELFTL